MMYHNMNFAYSYGRTLITAGLHYYKSKKISLLLLLLLLPKLGQLHHLETSCRQTFSSIWATNCFAYATMPRLMAW